jgi:ABC-type oligopeptide transport system substrate-binding subunit
MTRLSISLLGSFRVALDGEPVTGFVSDKARALLAFLAVEAERPHRREALAGLLWPEYPERSARASLRNALANVRQVIGDREADPPFLCIAGQTIQFNPEADAQVDVRAFTESLETSCAEAIHGLEAAVALYQGGFLEEFSLPDSPAFEEWALLKREQLQRRALAALGRLADHYERRGEYERALRFAWRRVEADPYRGVAQRGLMRLLALSGQREAALAQYETFRCLLAEEMGVAPAEETARLYEQIQAGELTPPAPVPWVEVRVQHPAFLEEAAEREDAERPVFVARERELARLDSYLNTALVGQGQVVFVTGGPGRGKTALMNAFARRAMEAHPDLLVASGNCNAYSGVGDPYLPFREVLGMLSGDVEPRWAAGTITTAHARRLWAASPLAMQALVECGSALIGTMLPGAPLLSRAVATVPGAPPWLVRLKGLAGEEGPDYADLAQSGFFEQFAAVLRRIAVVHPLLLVVDDLQWVDGASTGLFFHLGRRLADSRILIVGAYRPEEVALGRGGERHPLEKVLAEFKRSFGDVWIDLARADEMGGRQFVEDFLDTEPNRLGEGFRSVLSHHTGGHPLFTIELLRDMQERGDVIADGDGFWIEGLALDWEALPARVEAVIAERIERLEDELREILSIASVEGEDFTAQVVARVQEAHERKLLRQLSQELEKHHRLVRERGEVRVGRRTLSRYSFAHALFRQYLYNDLSAGERRLLHRATAEVLEELYGVGAAEIAVQLAHHWERAEVAEKAIEYLLQAGDQARLAYAHAEAIDYYQRALAFLKQGQEHGRAARTLMKLGLTYHTAFDFPLARQSYEEGFALWQRAGETRKEALSPAPHALRFVWYDPVTLDPAMALDLNSNAVIDQLFCGLVELSPEMDVVPDIARSWEVLEGGRQYVFQLRDDVRWSDGARLTAGDLEYAWKRVLDPATGSPNASLLYDVKAARAFHRGETGRGDVGVRALDEVTLAVELEVPAGYFLHLLSHTATYPVPRHVVEPYGEGWAETANIVTNGPFRLDTWRRGELMAFSRYPDYYNRSLSQGNLQRVELTLRRMDSSTRLEMYENDGLDTVGPLGPKAMDRARQRHAGEYVSLPELQTGYLGFDASRPPFDDARVRRAFALATDRETLGNVLARGYRFPGTGGFIPPGMPGHSAGIALPYDPDQARHLLAEAGHPGGRGFPAVDALTFTGPEHPAIIYFQAQWRENLGVEIAWQATGDFGAFLDRLNSEPSHIHYNGWVADYPDPDNFLSVGFPWQATGWRNETCERLVEEARQTTDQGKRIALYRQAERLLVEEAAIVPLTYGRMCLLVKPWVSRYPLSATGRWFWKDVIIEPH